MKAITLTALFIAAMTMSNISSAAGAHDASLTSAQIGTQLNHDDEDEIHQEFVTPAGVYGFLKLIRGL